MQYLQKFSLLIPLLVTEKGSGTQQLPYLVTECTKETEGQKFIRFHVVLELLDVLSPECVQ
jgi:hypothetical protein